MKNRKRKSMNIDHLIKSVGPKTKVWVWSLSGKTYMRTGIAFAKEPDEVANMLSDEGFLCDNLNIKELDASKPLHILMETVMDKVHLYKGENE